MKQVSLCPRGAGGGRGGGGRSWPWPGASRIWGSRGRPAGPLGAQVRVLPALQPFAPSQLLAHPLPTVPSC